MELMDVVHLLCDALVSRRILPLLQSLDLAGVEQRYVVPKAVLNGQSTNLTPADLESHGVVAIPEIPARTRLVIAHSLFGHSARRIAQYRGDAHIAWAMWGGDYVWMIRDQEDESYMLPRSRALMPKFSPKHPRSFRKRIRKVAKAVLRRDERTFTLKALARIDTFLTVLEDDYKQVLITRGLDPAQSRRLPFTYYAVADQISLPPKNGTIQVGHSAALHQNHVDVLHTLAGLGMTNRPILCPLSYGNATYADHVEAEGRALFGDSFSALRTFLPLEKYRSILRASSVAIFGNSRQEGFGNVTDLLFGGTHVVLRKENPAYDYFTELGFVLSDVETFYRRVRRDPGAPLDLPKAAQVRNHELAHSLFSQSAIQQAYCKMVAECLEKYAPRRGRQ